MASAAADGILTFQVIMEMVSPFAVELLLPSFLSGLAVKAVRSLNFCKMLVTATDFYRRSPPRRRPPCKSFLPWLPKLPAPWATRQIRTGKQE